MLGKYILNANGNPKFEKDVIKWGKWFEDGNNRRIAYDVINGKCVVSTVFLAIDSSFMFKGTGRPLLFETMVFGLPDGSEECKRYFTKEEALRGHKKLLKKYQKV